MTVPRTTASLLAVAMLLSLRTASAATPSEHDVRAAYVLNILRLTERRTAATRSDFVLCIVAAGAVERPLRILEGTAIRGRKLVIRRVDDDNLARCEAVFFGRSSGAESILAKAETLGLLTVGNDSDFVPSSGMVALVVENRRIVIELNRQALKSGEWGFSSHLLELVRLASGGTQ